MLNLFDPKLSGYGQSGTGRHIGRVNVKWEFSFSISIFLIFKFQICLWHLVLFWLKKAPQTLLDRFPAVGLQLFHYSIDRSQSIHVCFKPEIIPGFIRFFCLLTKSMIYLWYMNWAREWLEQMEGIIHVCASFEVLSF